MYACVCIYRWYLLFNVNVTNNIDIKNNFTIKVTLEIIDICQKYIFTATIGSDSTSNFKTHRNGREANRFGAIQIEIVIF